MRSAQPPSGQVEVNRLLISLHPSLLVQLTGRREGGVEEIQDRLARFCLTRVFFYIIYNCQQLFAVYIYVACEMVISLKTSSAPFLTYKHLWEDG